MTTDELMHPVGEDGAWSESYYFNFVDPESGIAIFTRMGFRPRNGWADALHVVYLGGDHVAFTYGRRDIGLDLSQYDGDLKVGSLEITCVEPFKRWKMRYDGPAQDIDDAAILLTRSKTRPEGWFRPEHLSMDVDFESLTPVHFAHRGTTGHFEQSVRATGSVTIGGKTRSFSGLGVRDKSWGPRNWGGQSTSGGASASSGGAARTGPRFSTPEAPSPFVVWFSMNFGEGLSMGGSTGRGPDGVIRGAGWMQEGDKIGDLTDVVIESDFRDNSILHTGIVLTGKAPDGRAIRITGKVESMCPTKIPFPGGATFVNEGVATFDFEGRKGTGIAEEWHNVVEQA